MDIRLPFNLIWKKGNASPLLQAFVGRVEPQSNWSRSNPAQ
jgi:hypothetical protein